MWWEPNFNSRAGIQFADNFQGAPMQFDLGLGQRQTQAGAFVTPVQRAIDLPKFLQGLGDVAGAHSNAGVRHIDY